MDTWVWHQISLELGDIDVERTIETKGRGEGGDTLSNETIQVGVGRALDIEVTTANIIQSLFSDKGIKT